MRKFRITAAFALGLVALHAVGCGGDDSAVGSGGDAGPSPDSSIPDTSVAPDATTGSDAGSDSGSDASGDADAGISDAATDAGVGGPNSVFDGTKTINFETITVTFNASGPSAGYLGYMNDFSYSAGIGGPSATGSYTCANASLTHAQPGFVSYSSSYGSSTCTINVTSFPTNSGDHFTGTYSGTIFRPDGVTSITLTNGKFDGIRP